MSKTRILFSFGVPLALILICQIMGFNSYEYNTQNGIGVSLSFFIAAALAFLYGVTGRGKWLN